MSSMNRRDALKLSSAGAVVLLGAVGLLGSASGALAAGLATDPVVVKDQLWIGYVGENGNDLYVASYNGTTWGDQVQVGNGAQTNGIAPALAIYESALYMCYANGGNLYLTSYNGTTWSNPVQVGSGAQTGNTAPALGVFGTKLWVGYVGSNGNNMYVISYDGTTNPWGKQIQVGGGAQTNSIGMALESWDSNLWVGYTGENGNNMYVIPFDGVSRWGSQSGVGSNAQTNKAAVGLASFDPNNGGQTNPLLYVGFTGKNGSNMYLCSYDGKFWGKQVQVGGAKTNGVGPALTTWTPKTDGQQTTKLWVGYPGANGTNMYVISYDGTKWGSQIQVKNDNSTPQTKKGVAVAIAAQ